MGSGARHIPILTLVGIVVVGLSVVEPTIWTVLLIEGALAAGVIASAAGWGAWPAARLRAAAPTAAQQICLATLLGLGILSFAALSLGLAGLLRPASAWVLLCGGLVLGVAKLQAAPRAARPTGGAALRRREARPALVLARALLLATLAAPLAAALFGASLPTGLLWRWEAGGYDALEYHLQAPREYYDAGRIVFLPHNVYASFPQQVEMLYLLLMNLLANPLRASIAAQLLHALLGVVAVGSIAAWSKPGWPRTLAAVIAGTIPWMAYLAALAYVELGLLAFTAGAAGILLQARTRAGRDVPAAAPIAAGLCAGLACGCKYTALALVAAALALGWMFASRERWTRRLRTAALFLFVSGAAFAPWLVRNAVLAGNPVYPFAYEIFGGRDWSPAQAAQWHRAHHLPDDRASLADRASVAWHELVGGGAAGALEPQMPFGLLLLPIAGLGSLVALRYRRARLPIVALLATLAVWAGATRMPGRFLTPIIAYVALAAPGVLLLARILAAPVARRFLFVAAMTAAAGCCAWSGAEPLRMLAQHAADWRRRTNISYAQMLGASKEMSEVHALNGLGPGARIHLVGDAAVFYIRPSPLYFTAFNRDAWLLAARDQPAADAVAALRRQGATHLVFCWPEIERLRATYGFPEFVTRAWAARLAAEGGLLRSPPEAASSGAVYEIYQLPGAGDRVAPGAP